MSSSRDLCTYSATSMGLNRSVVSSISPRRVFLQSTKPVGRRRVGEVVLHEGLALLGGVPEPLGEVVLAQRPEEENGVHHLDPVEIRMAPLADRPDVFLGEEVLHPVVDLLVGERLQVSPEDLEARHLVAVGGHVLDVVTPERLLAVVASPRSALGHDLPEDHARVHRRAYPSRVERPGQPRRVARPPRTRSRPCSRCASCTGTCQLPLEFPSNSGTGSESLRVLDGGVVLHVLVDQALQVVVELELLVAAGEAGLGDAQPDVDPVLSLREDPGVAGWGDELVEMDQAVVGGEVTSRPPSPGRSRGCTFPSPRCRPCRSPSRCCSRWGGTSSGPRRSPSRRSRSWRWP